MPILRSVVNPTDSTYQANEAVQHQHLDALQDELAKALDGGGETYRKRHKGRGKLLARERISLLLDEGAPFLEFSSLVGYGSEFAVGGAIVTGLGVVSGVECVIAANDPTVRGGAINPYGLKKHLRALEIARENRLPVINLVESGGADLPTQADLFIPAGQLFRDITRLSALGIPTIAIVFGTSTAGGAYVPGMSDYAVLVDQGAKVFLGGPPLVKMATGEESDDESLGGARMHSTTSGLGDYFAANEHDGIRMGREIVASLHWQKKGPGRVAEPVAPVADPKELLGVISGDLKVPFDPREIIARLVDGSQFDEYKAHYGTSLVTGWAVLGGYKIGIIANARGVLFNDEAKKGAEFIMLANQTDTPLLFLHNTTGFMVGKAYEQAGMVKDGAKMVNAVANSTVPHLSVIMGASYGAGNYAMCGRAFGPRFAFSWPGAQVAVMGPEQLAGVLSIVARQSAESKGLPFDEESDDAQRRATEAQIEREQHAFVMSGKLYDDGILDPRHTRTALAMCLSAIHSAPIEGRRGFGVFRF